MTVCQVWESIWKQPTWKVWKSSNNHWSYKIILLFCCCSWISSATLETNIHSKNRSVAIIRILVINTSQLGWFLQWKCCRKSCLVRRVPLHIFGFLINIISIQTFKVVGRKTKKIQKSKEAQLSSEHPQKCPELY